LFFFTHLTGTARDTQQAIEKLSVSPNWSAWSLLSTDAWVMITASLLQNTVSSTFQYVCVAKVDYWLIVIVMLRKGKRFCGVEVEEE